MGPQQRLQLSPELQQHLRLNPALVLQQTHYQRLLELSNEEALEELMSALADNPYLEEDGGTESSPSDSPVPEASLEELASSDQPPELLRTEETTEYDIQQNPFAYYTMFWHAPHTMSSPEESDEEEEPWEPEERQSLYEVLWKQLPLLDLSPEERLFAEELIGSLDPDGYLRESVETLLQRTNARIAELNYERLTTHQTVQPSDNPAWRYALDPIAAHLVLNRAIPNVSLLTPLTLEHAERLLKRLQRELDPPGVGARTLQECLLAQLEARPLQTEAEHWAYRILQEAFPALTRRTWQELLRHFGGQLTPTMLQQAYEVIRHLNPRPGVAASQEPPPTVSPDFTVTRDPETGELQITLNDGILPTLNINALFRRLQHLQRQSSLRHINPQARQALRRNYVVSRAILTALQQRKHTLLAIMTAIVKLQREFFEYGPAYLKPMIYADVSRETGFDTSTVCRAVANKHVQTDFGIFALRELFTEALPSASGEEAISVEVVKQKLRELLEHEDPNKPLSDMQLARKLHEMGYKVARRTVAKYREEMGFPPMWKRKALR